MASYISNFLSISLLICVYHLIKFLFKPNHFCTSICHVRILFSSLRLSLAAPSFIQAPRLHVFKGGQGPSRSNRIVSGRQRSCRSRHYIFAREYAKDCRDRGSNRRPHPRSNTDTLDRSATVDQRTDKVTNKAVD